MDDNLARWSYDLNELKAVQALAEAGDRRPSIHDVQVEALCELLDAISEAILVTASTDGEDEILFVNSAFSREIGYEPNEIVGTSLVHLVSWRTDDGRASDISEAVQSLAHADTIIYVTTRSGFQMRTTVIIEPMPMLWSGRVCLMARFKRCTRVGDRLRKHAHAVALCLRSALLRKGR